MEKNNGFNQKHVEISDSKSAEDKLSAEQRKFAEVLGLSLAQKWSEETTCHEPVRASDH